MDVLDQVAAIFFKGLVCTFRISAGDPLMAANVTEDLQQTVTAHVKHLQQTPCSRPLAFVGQNQQEVFNADVFILETPGLLLRTDQQAVESLGDIDLSSLNPRA